MLVCGGASAILGVLYALMQHDLKRLLAYHSIENIGIILLGLGAGMMALSAGRPELAAVGIAASLFHVLNHALFKGLLFLGAGGVVVATGTRHIEEMGGLAKRMPWTALFFLVGAAAISGLPLLNGFVERVAALPGVPVRVPSLLGSPRALPVSGGGGAPGADERAGGGVLREGVRDHVPGAAAGRGGGEGARVAGVDARCRRRSWPSMCVVLGLVPGWVLEALRGVAGSLPGVRPAPEMVRGWFAIAPGTGTLRSPGAALRGAGGAAGPGAGGRDVAGGAATR